MNRSKRWNILLLAGLFTLMLSSASFAQLLRDPEAEQYYNNGLAELEKENYNDAIDLFNQAIEIEDTYAEAYSARGDAFKELKDYNAALQSYRSAIDIDSNMAMAYNGRGECYRELGQMDLAFNDFNNAIEIDTRNPKILANIGMLCIDNRDPMRGLPYLDKALEQDDQNADALRSRGYGEALLQQFDKAIEDLEKSAEIDPTDYETYSTLASVNVFAEDYNKAVDAITKAIENYEPEERTDPEIFYSGYLSRAQWRFELAKDADPDEQKKLYEAIIEDCDTVLDEYPDTQPQTGRAYFHRGIALRMLGRLSEAIKSLTDSIQAVPVGEESVYLSEAYLRRGMCWHYQGQDSLAEGDFEQASAINYEDPLPYLWLGITSAQEEDYREAIRHYGDAIAKNPKFPLAYVNKGLAYLKLGEYQKAVDSFNEAIRIDTGNPDYFYKRGIAHLYLEEYQKAADSFSLAILNDKGHVKSYRGMIRALKGLGNDDLAREYEQKVDQLESAVHAAQ